MTVALSPAQLFIENERLTTYQAKRWFPTTDSEIHDDIMGEARIGLWKACMTYNPDKGYEFSTYACRVISNQINMFLRKRKRIVTAISFETDIGGGLTLGDTLGYEPDPAAEIDEIDIGKYKYLSMIVDGMTQKVIAERVGLSQSYVSRLSKKEKAELLQEIGVGL